MNFTTRFPRAVLNFTHHCALGCKWCYVPFKSSPVCKEIVILIVERIADIGFKVITIGGGDPFQYDFIIDLLRKAKSHNLFVHVDTNGMPLRESSTNLRIIENGIDLLGLPLDGPVPEIHDLVRGHHGHFDIIMSKLRWLRHVNNKIKINTIATASNVSYLSCISEIIKMVSPSFWSIYQYWAIGPAAHEKSIYSVPKDLFIANVSQIDIHSLGKETKVEFNASESRRCTYPIIHHDGKVYVHEKFPNCSFVEIGSIFDYDIQKKIYKSCSGDRPEAVNRYVI